MLSQLQEMKEQNFGVYVMVNNDNETVDEQKENQEEAELDSTLYSCIEKVDDEILSDAADSDNDD